MTKRLGLSGPHLRLAPDGQRTLKVSGRLLPAAHHRIGDSQNSERCRFAMLVFDLPADGQRLLGSFDRFLESAQQTIHITESVEREYFPPPVAQFAPLP